VLKRILTPFLFVDSKLTASSQNTPFISKLLIDFAVKDFPTCSLLRNKIKKLEGISAKKAFSINE
jgi:hypothetical protein